MRLKNLKAFTSNIKGWTVFDFLTTFAVLFAMTLVIVQLYQINRDLPYEETVQITDPVVVDKKEYKKGDTIVGFFEGERYSDKTAIFNRTLVCDNFRAILTPVRAEKPPVGPINRDSALFSLEDDIFLVPTLHVTPQKDCEVIYAPQTVVEKYILGGEKLQNDQSFRTTSFDIVEEYTRPEEELRNERPERKSVSVATVEPQYIEVEQPKEVSKASVAESSKTQDTCRVKVLDICLIR